MTKGCIGVSWLACVAAMAACSATPSDAVSGALAAGSAMQATDAGAPDASLMVDDAPPCVEPDAGLPSDVFCIGLYAGRDATQYQPDAVPYKPGLTLWSDGADKKRYLYLPPGATIDTSELDHWSFPVGTRAWKEFRFNGVLVETRLLWKRAEKLWEAGTYIWAEDQRSATLNTSRKPVILATGYEIPTAKDCGKCHHGGADKLLGVEAVALGLPTAEGLTLTRLAERDRLSDPPEQTSVFLPEDGTGLAAAALGYLHVNCGMPCHSSRGLGHETDLLMRLRADEIWADGRALMTDATQTQTYRNTVQQMAVTGAVTSAFPDDLRIVPGDHEQSLVWVLSHRRGEYQMPPLVTHVVDDVGTKQLADWIDALPSP